MSPEARKSVCSGHIYPRKKKKKKFQLINNPPPNFDMDSSACNDVEAGPIIILITICKARQTKDIQNSLETQAQK